MSPIPSSGIVSDQEPLSNPDEEYTPKNAGAEEPGSEGYNINAQKEDKEAERSESTGEIPKGEVDSLNDSLKQGDGILPNKTRGVKSDAYKQERELDQALYDGDVINKDEDI